MFRRKRRLGVSAITAAVLAVAVAAPAFAVPKITMSGSTSVAPLMTLLIRAYLHKYPHKAKFTLAQGGSGVGIADVANKRVSVGNSSRDQAPSDPPGLVFNKIARDAVCLITNNKNTLANLDQTTIKAIFSGQVRNWEDVPGSSVTGPIDLITRTAASGTADAFSKIFMGSTAVTTNVAAQASNGLVQQKVQSDPNAIGYVSLDFVNGTNPVAYQGVACNLANAKSSQYAGVRNFWMVTRGAPTGGVLKFISWIQGSPIANKIIGTHWVPLHD